MTAQPEHIPLDALTSDDLDRLYDRLDRAEAEAPHWHEAESADIAAGAYAGRVAELEAEVHRLTAGQCTHTRGTHQHHAAPVEGCPWCAPGTDTTPPTTA